MGRKKYTPEIHAYRMEIYSHELCDRLLAKEFNTTQGGVRTWRYKYGLAQYPDKEVESMPAPITQAEHQRRMDAYNLDPPISDVEAGKRLGVTKACFGWWRKLHNLPPRFAKGEKESKIARKTAHVKMRKVLSPEDCQTVNEFFYFLVKAAELVPRGEKTNVGMCMKQWRIHESGMHHSGVMANRRLREETRG